MGCSGQQLAKDNKAAFKSVESLLKELKCAINEYEKYKKDYEDMLMRQEALEHDLDLYFNIKGERNLRKEEGLIKIYPLIFAKIRSIEDKLQVNPKFLFKERNKNVNTNSNEGDDVFVSKKS